MRLASFALALAGLVLSACATTAPPAATPLDVAVTKSNDAWTADFTFPRPARAWVFVRSAIARSINRPWRPQSWTVETPGVTLQRRGRYDVLAAEDGGPVPDHVRVRFTPFGGGLIADYTPALVFTDGSVALFSEQFDAFPLESPRRAERLPVDLSGLPFAASPTRVTFRDTDAPVLHQGQRRPSTTVEGDNGGYILFGPAEPAPGEAMATIIDPALPEWIRSSLLRDTPVLLARHAEALGPRSGPRPTLMVAWAGPTPHLASMGGSVLPGTIVMTYEGEGVLAENDALRRQGLWFIAHEAAHFWLGETVAYQYSRDAWITEGGADLLALRAIPAVDRGYDAREMLQSAVGDCAELTRRRGVASAEQRSEHRAYYACGAVFGLVAETASHRPFSDFVRGLIDANRADRVVTRGEWLAALDRATGKPELSAAIARLIDRGAEDPKAAIADLLRRAGVAFTLADDGTPRLT
jgi:hypothetical protein